MRDRDLDRDVQADVELAEKGPTSSARSASPLPGCMAAPPASPGRPQEVGRGLVGPVRLAPD